MMVVLLRLMISPDRGGIDLPTDTFNGGEGPTEAELQEFPGDVEMKPVEEAEVPVEGKGNAPDREAEVPQAAAAASRPTVESPAAKRAASPDREERRAKNPAQARSDQPRYADLLRSQVHGR